MHGRIICLMPSIFIHCNTLAKIRVTRARWIGTPVMWSKRIQTALHSYAATVLLSNEAEAIGTTLAFMEMINGNITHQTVGQESLKHAHTDLYLLNIIMLNSKIKPLIFVLTKIRMDEFIDEFIYPNVYKLLIIAMPKWSNRRNLRSKILKTHI